jgi:GDP-L-fucose synthase
LFFIVCSNGSKGFLMFYHGSRVLVTGGSGFVGSHLVEELLKQGALVRIIVHKREAAVNDSRVEQVIADLANPEECAAAFAGSEYVFHAAGGVGAAGTVPSDQMDGIAVNLLLTARALQAAWSAGVKRFLLYSSSTVYPDCSWPVGEDEAWEGPPHPAYFGYGWMRRYLEKLAEFVASKSNLRIAIVRPTAVYGRRDNFDSMTGHVISALILRSLRKEDPFVVWGNGGEVRDFLHITDLARGSLLALEKYADCDPINIGSGQEVTIRQIADAVLAASGHSPKELIFDSSKPTTIPYRAVDISKARNVLGFVPSVPLDEGLNDTIRWYRSSQSAQQDRKG